MATTFEPEERRRITILAIPMVAFTISVYVGNALAPTLLKQAPLLLLFLSPKMRWLLLASPRIDTVWFFAVPLLRSTAVLTTYYTLGRWFGDRALRWLEARSGQASRPVLWIERKFHSARVPVTFLLPGPVPAMLAGADRMPAPLFFGTALGSIGLRLVAIRALAEALREPLLKILDWIGDYQWYLTLASIVGVVAWASWSNRKHLGPDESVEEIIEEFEALTEEMPPEPDVNRAE